MNSHNSRETLADLLRQVHTLPYNNASVQYWANGQSTDKKWGGDCRFLAEQFGNAAKSVGMRTSYVCQNPRADTPHKHAGVVVETEEGERFFSASRIAHYEPILLSAEQPTARYSCAPFVGSDSEIEVAYVPDSLVRVNKLNMPGAKDSSTSIDFDLSDQRERPKDFLGDDERSKLQGRNLYFACFTVDGALVEVNQNLGTNVFGVRRSGGRSRKGNLVTKSKPGSVMFADHAREIVASTGITVDEIRDYFRGASALIFERRRHAR